MRLAAALTCASALVARVLVRQLDDHFVLPGTPLGPLCLLLAAPAAVLALAPGAMVRTRTFALVCLGAARVAVPLVLTLTWTREARELWSAAAVLVALHDGQSNGVPEAPLAPVALAIAGVVGWTATTTEVAPATAVLVGLLAGVAAHWGAERAAEQRAR